MLLGFAALLALLQTFGGPAHAAWPDLPLLGLTSFVPLLLATRIVDTPGAASAACGAYLLPRTLLSLLIPGIDLPPLLLIPTLAFDLVWWLRTWPVRRRRRRGPSPPLTLPRAIAAGATFGIVLALVEPPFRVFTGQDPIGWTGPNLWLAAAVTAVQCAALSGLSRAS